MRAVNLIVVLAFVIGTLPGALAQGKSKGRGDVDVNLSIVFGSDQLLLIRGQFDGRSKAKHRHLPPGLAKRETLRPGL